MDLRYLSQSNSDTGNMPKPVVKRLQAMYLKYREKRKRLQKSGRHHEENFWNWSVAREHAWI